MGSDTTTPVVTAERFTTYLSAKERALLRRWAKMNMASENYVVRVALRQLFGLEKSHLKTPKNT